jgi:4-hydroxythreonine-4-phosphate dehydrogenase
VILLSWLRRKELNLPPFFCAGGVEVLRSRAGELGLAAEIRIFQIDKPCDAARGFPDALPVIEGEPRVADVEAGKPSFRNADFTIGSIEAAVGYVISGEAAAVVTAPIAKDVLLRAGFAYAGHTDFLAELARRHGYGSVHPVMLMASGRLRAVPITVHIPLKDVPSRLTRNIIIESAEVTAAALSRYFGVPAPRLAFCGLNPHAGENGEMGREDIEVIAPAISELQRRGIHASGPYPADTLFHEAARKNYDAVLAMYHDQALIPFKTLSFEDGVNVTLGLPFIRTSPDHGTAFSIAGTGKANPASFIEALRLAHRMSLTVADTR